MQAPEILLDRAGIESTIARLAHELSEAHHDGLIMIGVLRGSVPFMADLVRAMTIRTQVDFVAVTPYSPGTGRVRLLMDTETNLEGRDVVVVEDIIDTGLTSAFLLGEFGRRSPRSLSLCTLVNRPVRRVVPVEIAHQGLSVGDQFVVGYGLDFDGRYRNVPVLAAGELDVLQQNPDAYVPALYGA